MNQPIFSVALSRVSEEFPYAVIQHLAPDVQVALFKNKVMAAQFCTLLNRKGSELVEVLRFFNEGELNHG